MAGLIHKNFDRPEETRSFDQNSGKLELINLDGGPVGRATFQPGWRWSTHMKSKAGTESCQVAHRGYIVSGRMKVVMDDGEEAEYGPGDCMEVPPGTRCLDRRRRTLRGHRLAGQRHLRQAFLTRRLHEKEPREGLFFTQ